MEFLSACLHVTCIPCISYIIVGLLVAVTKGMLVCKAAELYMAPPIGDSRGPLRRLRRP